ncbi:MAG: uS2 family ribosomal protein, partial [Muribaculaceae bacterium]|nr:uS2 family ribosomal protein [Muribaculaceae bacterium]
DFVIPANDDASKSIEIILDTVCAAMNEGLEERKAEKVDAPAAEAEAAAPKRERRRVARKEEAAEAPVAEVTETETEVTE